MALSVQIVNFDSEDAHAIATFWSGVLRRPVNDDSAPGDENAVVRQPDGPAFWFGNVPEPKTVKNRVHVCLQAGTDRDAEVERVLALGATLVDDRRKKEPGSWVVLADPEGNEFCILGSDG